MATKSHGRCKVCRVIIHSNHRFGMCAKHGREHYARLQRERQEAKARKRARQTDLPRSGETTVLEEDEDMAEGTEPAKPGRKPAVELTEDQKVEMIDAYTKTDEPAGKLIERYGVPWARLYSVLDQTGITWRRGDSITYEQWQAQQARQDSVPEPVARAIENMVDQDHVLRPARVLPPRPEPVAPTPAVERRIRPEYRPGTHFLAEVSGHIELEAESMIEAIQILVQRWPDLRVKSIIEQG